MTGTQSTWSKFVEIKSGLFVELKITNSRMIQREKSKSVEKRFFT